MNRIRVTDYRGYWVQSSEIIIDFDAFIKMEHSEQVKTITPFIKHTGNGICCVTVTDDTNPDATVSIYWFDKYNMGLK